MSSTAAGSSARAAPSSSSELEAKGYGWITDAVDAAERSAQPDDGATRHDLPRGRRPSSRSCAASSTAAVAYLDSAATSQTPQPVIDAMLGYYTRPRASVHRGVYPLAVEATDLFEGARDRIAAWLGRRSRRRSSPPTPPPRSTSSPTRGAARTSAPATSSWSPRWSTTPTSSRGSCSARSAGPSSPTSRCSTTASSTSTPSTRLLARGPKLVCVAHVSNVLGTINPVAEIARRPTRPARSCSSTAPRRCRRSGRPARARRRLLRLDRPQGVRADRHRRAARPARAARGDAAVHQRRPHDPAGRSTTTRPGPTCPASSRRAPRRSPRRSGSAPLSTGSQALGIDAIRAHEQALTAELLERLAEVPGLTVHGPAAAADRGALVSFALDGAHPHDIGEILGREGVCVRAGHHCAQPLMRRSAFGATTRASFAVHNSLGDVQRLIDGLGVVRSRLQLD